MNWKFWERGGDERQQRGVSAGRRFMGAMRGGMFSSGTKAADKWPTFPTTPDAFITQSWVTLVSRSREQWSNNDYAKGFVRLIRQNVIGPQGVKMQAKVKNARGKLEQATNDALEADFADWGKKGNCDVTGKLSWRDCQCLAAETLARDGEFIVQLVFGDDAGPHGFALQFIDPMRLPVWRKEDRVRGSTNFIRHGIEFNKWGRPVAYHFTSDLIGSPEYYNVGAQGMIRIAAEHIIHEFIPEMVGMKRGIPWLATSLQRLRNLNLFEEAALQNARASAIHMGFITYREGTGPIPEDGDDSPLNFDFDHMAFRETPEGAEVTPWKGAFPDAETASFTKTQLRGASTGMGVPYNELANDLENVNFSSIRQNTLDSREHYMELQEFLIEAFVAPVRAAHLKWRLLGGKIKVGSKVLGADRLQQLSAVTFQPRRWTWIDPNADVKGKLEEVRGGLADPSDVIREQGRDPDTVFEGIAASIAAMKAAGIPEKYIDQFMQGTIAGNMKGKDKEPANDPSKT